MVIVRDVRMRARRNVVVVAVMMISSWSYVHRCSCSFRYSSSLETLKRIVLFKM